MAVRRNAKTAARGNGARSESRSLRPRARKRGRKRSVLLFRCGRLAGGPLRAVGRGADAITEAITEATARSECARAFARSCLRDRLPSALLLSRPPVEPAVLPAKSVGQDLYVTHPMTSRLVPILAMTVSFLRHGRSTTRGFRRARGRHNARGGNFTEPPALRIEELPQCCHVELAEVDAGGRTLVAEADPAGQAIERSRLVAGSPSGVEGASQQGLYQACALPLRERPCAKASSASKQLARQGPAMFEAGRRGALSPATASLRQPNPRSARPLSNRARQGCARQVSMHGKLFVAPAASGAQKRPKLIVGFAEAHPRSVFVGHQITQACRLRQTASTKQRLRWPEAR